MKKREVTRIRFDPINTPTITLYYSDGTIEVNPESKKNEKKENKNKTNEQKK